MDDCQGDEGIVQLLTSAFDRDELTSVVSDEDYLRPELLIGLNNLVSVIEVFRTIPALRGRLNGLRALRDELTNAVLGASGPLRLGRPRGRGHPVGDIKKTKRMMVTGVAVELLARRVGEAKGGAKEALEIWRAIAGPEGPKTALKTLEGWHSRAVAERGLHSAAVADLLDKFAHEDVDKAARYLIQKAVNLS